MPLTASGSVGEKDDTELEGGRVIAGRRASGSDSLRSAIPGL